MIKMMPIEFGSMEYVERYRLGPWFELHKMLLHFCQFGTKNRPMTNILALKVPLLLTLIAAEMFIVYIGKGLGNLEINPSAREEKNHFFPFDFSRSWDFFGEKFSVDWKASSKHYPLQHFDFAMIVRCREKAKGKIVTVMNLSRRPPKG